MDGRHFGISLVLEPGQYDGGDKRLKQIAAMDAKCFDPSEPAELLGHFWWVATTDGIPVGYSGAKQEASELRVTRQGVLAAYRGHHLQARMLRCIVRLAKRRHIKRVVSYVHPANAASGNSFIAAGFKMYAPWGETANWVHWIKELS